MMHLLIALVLLAAAGFAGVISEPLQLEMAQAAPGQLIPVLIKPVGRGRLDYINSVSRLA
jgi:hypothetical protein